MKLLADPNEIPNLRLDSLPSGVAIHDPGLPPTTRAALSAVDEPLEVVPPLKPGLGYHDAYASLGILPPRELRLRPSVLARLEAAEESIAHAQIGIALLDGWRSTGEQELLIEHYSQAGPTAGFVAPTTANAPRAPHTTGGAVDLTLSWEGVPLGLGTDFDSFVATAGLLALEDEDSLLRRLRRILASALAGQGFVGLRTEWWHWSFGDDYWAKANHCDAIYNVWQA